MSAFGRDVLNYAAAYHGSAAAAHPTPGGADSRESSSDGDAAEWWHASIFDEAVFRQRISGVRLRIKNMKAASDNYETGPIDEIYRTWKYNIEVVVSMRDAAASDVISAQLIMMQNDQNVQKQNAFRIREKKSSSDNTTTTTEETSVSSISIRNFEFDAESSLFRGTFLGIHANFSSDKVSASGDGVSRMLPPGGHEPRTLYRFCVLLLLNGRVLAQYFSGPFMVLARARKHFYETEKAKKDGLFVRTASAYKRYHADADNQSGSDSQSLDGTDGPHRPSVPSRSSSAGRLIAPPPKLARVVDAADVAQGERHPLGPDSADVASTASTVSGPPFEPMAFGFGVACEQADLEAIDVCRRVLSRLSLLAQMRVVHCLQLQLQFASQTPTMMSTAPVDSASSDIGHPGSNGAPAAGHLLPMALLPPEAYQGSLRASGGGAVPVTQSFAPVAAPLSLMSDTVGTLPVHQFKGVVSDTGGPGFLLPPATPSVITPSSAGSGLFGALSFGPAVPVLYQDALGRPVAPGAREVPAGALPMPSALGAPELAAGAATAGSFPAGRPTSTLAAPAPTPMSGAAGEAAVMLAPAEPLKKPSAVAPFANDISISVSRTASAGLGSPLSNGLGSYPSHFPPRPRPAAAGSVASSSSASSSTSSAATTSDLIADESLSVHRSSSGEWPTNASALGGPLRSVSTDSVGNASGGRGAGFPIYFNYGSTNGLSSLAQPSPLFSQIPPPVMFPDSTLAGSRPDKA